MGFIELLVALVLAIPIFITGFIWGWIGKPIYEIIKGRYNWKQALKHFGKYFIDFLYQIYKVLERLAHYLALVIDLAGNVIAGEMFEDAITPDEDTLFGEGDCTLSAAIGELEANEIPMTKAGRRFSQLLNKVFGEESHCMDAYKAYLEWKNSKS